jgi:MFS family permease
MIMGLCGTLTLVGAQAALADRHGEQRAVALSEANVAASLGAMTVPLLAGAGEAAGAGWRLALAAGVGGGALLAWRVRSRGVTEDGGARPDDEAPAAGLPGRARVSLALVFCAVCAEWSVAFWGATFADDEVGLRATAAVALSSVFFGAMLLGRLAASALARRHGPARLVAGSLALALAGFPLLWTAGATVPAAAGFLLVGLGIGGLFPLSVALTFAAAPGRSTLASARAVTAGSVAILSAPFVLGQVADAAGLRAAFGLVPVFLLCAAVALAVLAGPRARPAFSWTSGSAGGSGR